MRSITQIERAAGFRREDTAEQRLDKREAVLSQATDDLGEAAPLLAALLSLPAGERYPPLNLYSAEAEGKMLQALVAQSAAPAPAGRNRASSRPGAAACRRIPMPACRRSISPAAISGKAERVKDQRYDASGVGFGR